MLNLIKQKKGKSKKERDREREQQQQQTRMSTEGQQEYERWEVRWNVPNYLRCLSGLWGSWEARGTVALVTKEAASVKSVSPLDSNTFNIPQTVNVKRAEEIFEPQGFLVKEDAYYISCNPWRMWPGVFACGPLGSGGGQRIFVNFEDRYIYFKRKRKGDKIQ